MNSPSQVADTRASEISVRRYVPLGKRLVPLSVLTAVGATAIAAGLAWRLYSPPWAGGVQRANKAPQPPDNRVVNAPGPDNRVTTLPPPEQRIIAGQKPSADEKPSARRKQEQQE